MSSFSILGSMPGEAEETLPEFFEDLNLDQLISYIGKGFEEYGIEDYYYRVPGDKETISYRRQILQDMDPVFEKQIMEFCLAVQKAQLWEGYARQLENRESSAHWHLMAACRYYEALDQLIDVLEEKEQKATGWEDFYRLCQRIVEREEYQDRRNCAMGVMQALSGLRYTLRIEKEHVSVYLGETEEDYVGGLCEKYPHIVQKPDRIANLLPGSQESTELEKHIIRYLKKKNQKVFADMMKYYEECPDFLQEDVLRFCREVSFYLAFLQFRHEMEANNHAFCYPEFVEDVFEVQGGYDLALALSNQEKGKRTVSNDYFYHGRELFFVVTGPNQGGKTTFARAAGQLVYFSLMGLPVPAEKVKMPLFNGLMTHFSVEESTETGRGKLKEELVRLSGIMKHRKENAFVVINELFTSAATFDALQMGKTVIQYFLDSECHGIYVTHIDKLAEESDRIVSMTATLDTEDHRKIRTYKIERRAAEGKGHVETIVEQYGLSYDDIIRRLAHD